MKNSKVDAPAFEGEEDFREGETGAGTMNRTGAATSPEMALDMIRMAQRTPADPDGDATALAEYRKPYIEDGSILGSRPLPNDSDGEDPDDPAALLLDKLGERLAFERQGVRLYECLIGKLKLLGPMPGGPTVKELEHILKEEAKHFQFLQQAIIRSGGDPTVQTPCANVAGVLSQGIVQIVADPRTTLVQCLEAMLNAELVDKDGWALLRELVDAQGVNELAEKIEEAEDNEQEHLEKVRGWLSALVIGEVSEEAIEEQDMSKSEDAKSGKKASPGSPRSSDSGKRAKGKAPRQPHGKKQRKP
jgi:hypothetical protein